MGIASMVIGIVSLVIGFVPFCGSWVVIPASAGLGLGIADVIVRSKRGQPKGMAIAGLVLNPMAIMVVIIWWAGLVSAADDATDQVDDDFQQQLQQMMQDLPGAPQQPQQAPLPGSAQPMEPMEPIAPSDTAASAPDKPPVEAPTPAPAP